LPLRRTQVLEDAILNVSTFPVSLCSYCELGRTA
jgi:hypothetical protein